MYFKKSFFVLFFIFFTLFVDKVKGQEYAALRARYENLEENDKNALPYINQYIAKAKAEKNYEKLAQGFQDGAYFSKNNNVKLKYADSAIAAAKKTNNNDIVSSCYLLKGSFYYFNYKQYQPALKEYINAFQYAKNTSDLYLKHKILYQLGLVKSYLGYYEEALRHFNECIDYFEPKTKGEIHPNEIFNNSKGYLNSIHQSIICYRNLKKYKKANSLILLGLNFTKSTKDFLLEKSYFLKCKGVSEYSEGHYEKAISSLNTALPTLKKNNDFAWISFSDFYIGKSFLALHQDDQAIEQFQKVDSIFQKHQFIVPELRENYELLIKYYKNKNDAKQELYYTNNLLKIDKLLAKEFTYLSSKIHKEYDTQILEDAKNKLMIHNKWSINAIIILCLVIALLSIAVWRYYKNEKEIKIKYRDLETKLNNHIKTAAVSYENISTETKNTINKDIFLDIQRKLKSFEDNILFTEKGLSLNRLAQYLETNSTYLSQYINEVRGHNFNKYLATLRINYITQMMYNDPIILRYSIQALSDKCGIASRQNFSDLFLEINGIRPVDFIKQREKELEDLKNAI